MSKLTKEQYAYRAESAARRQAKNGELIKSQNVPEEVSELLQELCSARHNLHCNMESLVKGYDGCDNPLTAIAQINNGIYESGFPYMESLPLDFFEIDDMSSLMDIEEMHSDDEGFQDWYDANYNRIFHELCSVNDQIEDYLRIIDEKYGTNFCPTGALRIM